MGVPLRNDFAGINGTMDLVQDLASARYKEGQLSSCANDPQLTESPSFFFVLAVEGYHHLSVDHLPPISRTSRFDVRDVFQDNTGVATRTILDGLDDLVECFLDVLDHLELMFAQGGVADFTTVMHASIHISIGGVIKRLQKACNGASGGM